MSETPEPLRAPDFDETLDGIAADWSVEMSPVLNRFVTIVRDVYSVQGYGARLILHIGSTAFYFGLRPGYGLRIELFTHFHRFRFSRRAHP